MASRLDVVKAAEAEYASHPTESWGDNYGPRIRDYQAVTGAYRAAWCVSFVQYVLKTTGLGPIADRTAAVWYLWAYAGRHGWQRGTPKAGLICVLPGLHRSGHMGLVESVNGTSINTIEGNSHNTVYRHTRRRSEFVGFVEYPAGAPAPPAKPPPLFQIVVGDGSKAHVVAIGPWGTLKVRMPQLVARYHAVRVQRKWRL